MKTQRMCKSCSPVLWEKVLSGRDPRKAAWKVNSAGLKELVKPAVG
jgi:hypothetical protein